MMKINLTNERGKIMAFDGLFTRAMQGELTQLVSGRITKIHQPNALEVMLQIRAAGANHKLLISIHPSYARMHVTNQSVDNPPEPPMFCTLLRKHVEGGFIQSISAPAGERIIEMMIESKNEIGDPVTRKLIVEIMGRHSNCLLIDAANNRILDSLKHLPPSLNSYRTVMPGQTYVAPPAQDKIDPFCASDEQIVDFFSRPREAKEVVQQFAGFSQLHAQELLYRLDGTNHTSVFRTFLQEIEQAVQPTYKEHGKVAFSPIALHHLEGHETTYATLGELLDRVFFARAERDRVKQQAGDLERWLSNEIDKLRLKLKKLDQDYARASKLDEFQLYGELLMANLYQFEKGVSSVTLENYYNGEKVTISVSPRKTPTENAQSYYTKYNKAKNALVMIVEQKEKAQSEIMYFEMLSQQVQQAAPADIEEIREELAEQGYLRLRASKKKKKPTKPMPEKYMSSKGIPISVGKNNKQNDYLTFKLAKKSDTWLHTKDIPGSHVVIHSDAPDETTLNEAAMLSAYFSKARDSASVPVDYTEIRQVKKPSGAKPGFVIYFEQKTLYVTPDEAFILQLKNQ